MSKKKMAELTEALLKYPPFDSLTEAMIEDIRPEVARIKLKKGAKLFRQGKQLEGLYVVESGALEIISDNGDPVSRRIQGDIMGERGLLRKGKALLTAVATEPTVVLMIPGARFHDLMARSEPFAKWFDNARPSKTPGDEGPYATGMTALQVSDMMSAIPITCTGEATIQDVALLMRDHSISSVVVMDGETISGIITVKDLAKKVLAEGLTGAIPVTQVMSPNPYMISPDSLGLDALMMLADYHVNHLPVAEKGRIVGMIGRTDLFRQQAATASHMVAEIVESDSAEEMAHVMTRVPDLLVQLVNSGIKPNAITRRITDITDAITHRLLLLAEAKFGPPPVPYLWLACGSQGRREQTGVSDQDNCLILDDGFQAAHDPYFADLAQFVSDGLNTCGFVYCPGDMMATNPRWRQPRRKWREYFSGWIQQPDTQAQMLASVMFDLRPIAGDETLFDDMQAEVLEQARKNSIFVAHMVSNSLKHSPPISLFRGVSLIRSGKNKNKVDLKHSGIVPLVDLGRVYALQGAVEVVNTRDRLLAAREKRVLSKSGARDLIDAFDLIAQTRLKHQAAQIKAGEPADNFMSPADLSDLEHNHLRDAFMVVKTLQSALGQGRATLG